MVKNFLCTTVYSLFTEIVNDMHNSNDIQFAEDGAWTSIRSKVSSSKTFNNDQNSVTHTVSGLYSVYFFQPVESSARCIRKSSL